MNATTIDHAVSPRLPESSRLNRLFSRIAEREILRAHGVARSHLLKLDDADLARLGHARSDVERWPLAGVEL
jgi:hypothetical protein